MLRAYTRIAGTLTGLFAAAALLGLWNVGYGTILVCLFTAVVFFVPSLWWRANEIRAVVGGVGVLHLLAGGFEVAVLFAVGSTWEDFASLGVVVYLSIGILSVLGAGFLPCEDGGPHETS